jgi:hypothetical protein
MLRRMVSRPVCRGVRPPSGAYYQIFITVRQLRVCWCGAPPDERTGLSFTIAAGPRQRSHSWVRVPYFTVSDSRLRQPGGAGPRIYIHQEEGGQVMPPGSGFPFRRLLRLGGLQLRYSTPPPYGDNNSELLYSLAVYRQSVRLGAKPLEDHWNSFFFFATEPLRS